MLRSRPRLYLSLVFAAALMAVIPLLLRGCSCGHDFDFHLLNWMEAARQMARGTPYPHWAYSPAWNAGEPRFVFYPPISWMLGALLTTLLTHLPGVPAGAGFGAAPIAYTALVLAGSGAAMYALGRRFVAPPAAGLAAIFYILNPYTLFTAYERTAYAELLAAAWIPLLFRAVLPRPESDRSGEISIPAIALPLALLWLTNAPAAAMSSYAAALILTVRVAHVWHRRRDVALCAGLAMRAVAGMALGLALAAFYIVPAAYEQRWVEIAMAVIPGMRIEDNFLFGHAPASMPDAAAHDAVLHTASLVAMILLLLCAALIAALFLRRREGMTVRHTVLPLAVMAVAIALLLLPPSLPLWRHLPELAFLQFPWRLLALLACACALLLALSLNRLRATGSRGTLILAPCLAGLLIWPAYAVFRQGCDPADLPAARLALFRSGRGTEPTDEYTPETADNDALRPRNPPFRLAPADDPPGSQAAPSGRTGVAPADLDLDPAAPATLILNLRDYPAWQVRVNGAAVAARHDREDGLLAIALAAGHDHVAIRYVRTPDQIAGDAVSALAWAVLVAMGVPALQRGGSRAARDR